MKILAVDDEPLMLRAYQAICSNQGWRVTIAQNGIEALECMAKCQFDVILLDIVMPRMDGEQFLTQTKVRNMSVPPVIVMTNSIVPAVTQQRMLRMGVAAYNQKIQIRPAELIRQIRHV